MIQNLDEAVYERNKDDPDWKRAYDRLQESDLIFRIRNLVVHPGARISASDVYSSSKNLVRMDLDTLELEAGYMRLPYYNYDITGGHLAFSLTGEIMTLRCKSEKPVDIGHAVIHEGGTLITKNANAEPIFTNIGANSTVKLATYAYDFYIYRRAAFNLQVGSNSYVNVQPDRHFPKSLEIGNNCKVLYSSRVDKDYIQTAVAPKKKIYYRRPNKIKDNTVCLLVN